jgi:hypothetical protein
LGFIFSAFLCALCVKAFDFDFEQGFNKEGAEKGGDHGEV